MNKVADENALIDELEDIDITSCPDQLLLVVCNVILLCVQLTVLGLVG